MGTRIHVFLSHNLPNADDATATIARLDSTLPAACAVRDYAKGSQDECIAQMRRAMGSPQPSVESVPLAVIAQTEHGVPDVWFLDGPTGD